MLAATNACLTLHALHLILNLGLPTYLYPPDWFISTISVSLQVLLSPSHAMVAVSHTSCTLHAVHLIICLGCLHTIATLLAQFSYICPFAGPS